MAGLQFIEGFETFGPDGTTGSTLQDNMRKKWISVSAITTAKISDVAYREEGLCFDLVSGSSSYTGIAQTVPPVSNEVIIGWAWYTGALTSNNRFLYFASSTDVVFTVFTLTGGGFRITHGGGLTDTPTGLVAADTWYYMELKYKIAESPDGYWELYIDGTLVDSDTGIDTWNSNRAQEIGAHQWSSGENANTKLDDIYIYDNTGDLQEPYGPVKVRGLFPKGDDTTQWTSTGGTHYTEVKDAPVNPATYIESETAANLDLFNFDNASDLAQLPVYGVQLNAYASVTDVGVQTLVAIADSAGSRASANEVLLDDIGGQYTFMFDTDPQTSAPWTIPNLTLARFGVEVG